MIKEYSKIYSLYQENNNIDHDTDNFFKQSWNECMDIIWDELTGITDLRNSLSHSLTRIPELIGGPETVLSIHVNHINNNAKNVCGDLAWNMIGDASSTSDDTQSWKNFMTYCEYIWSQAKKEYMTFKPELYMMVMNVIRNSMMNAWIMKDSYDQYTADPDRWVRVVRMPHMVEDYVPLGNFAVTYGVNIPEEIADDTWFAGLRRVNRRNAKEF